MRQTNLTLTELKTIIQGEPPKQCFYINEIGEIMMEGGEEAKKAEEILRGLLTSANQERQCLAFCWLFENVAELSPETIRKIGEFKKDPVHQPVIEIAEELIKNKRI